MAKVGQVNRGNDASTGELGSLTGKVMGFFLGIFFSALGGKSCFCFFFLLRSFEVVGSKQDGDVLLMLLGTCF